MRRRPRSRRSARMTSQPRFADAADPDVELYYNDYSFEPEKRDAGSTLDLDPEVEKPSVANARWAARPPCPSYRQSQLRH